MSMCTMIVFILEISLESCKEARLFNVYTQLLAKTTKIAHLKQNLIYY